jgi:S-adenosylmethionine:tRNA ribosyltransferase-isomerase
MAGFGGAVDIMRRVNIDEFDYELPRQLIAQFPSKNRGESRLLCLDAISGMIEDRRFNDFAERISPGDVLVMNDTRVIKARLLGTRSSGGKIEALVERIISPTRVLALVRTSHGAKVGQTMRFGESASARVIERQDNLFVLEFAEDVSDVLQKVGKVPLPPYIERDAGTEDEKRYQTVYARAPGAVAAPTAGLHFEQDMLDRLRAKGVACATVTLHVGAGTFQPVRVENVAEHVMHSEWYEVPPETVLAIEKTKRSGGRVFAVGTTSLRALESAASTGNLVPGSAETRLFIRPGFNFHVVDCLLTNFHVPRSTLMMLVSAFAGLENIRRAYRHAVDCGYRFLSYGDAMLIERTARKVGGSSP